jgi:hypothetical protein
LAACAGAPEVPGASPFAPTGLTAAEVTALSCPPGTPNLVAGDAIPVSVTPLPLDPADSTERQVGVLRFAGAYALEAADPRFGGLSGLATVDGVSFTAVGDQGSLLRFTLPEPGASTLTAQIYALRDAAGDPLDAKWAADAEGLAQDPVTGLTLVSFERAHRVLAYSPVCGALARGVPVADLDPTVLAGVGRAVGENAGPEALALLPAPTEGPVRARLMIGLEQGTASGAAVSLPASDGRPDFRSLRLPQFDGLLLTALEVVEGLPGGPQVIGLHRGYDPLRGNRIAVTASALTGEPGAWQLGPTRLLGRWERPRTIDNFEGMAVAVSRAGIAHIHLISDNNFSDDQRTLLMRFDWDPRASGEAAG